MDLVDDYLARVYKHKRVLNSLSIQQILPGLYSTRYSMIYPIDDAKIQTAKAIRNMTTTRIITSMHQPQINFA